MSNNHLAALVIVAGWGLCVSPAQSVRRMDWRPDTTLTIEITGTLGPKLKGSDPIVADGQKITVVVRASEASKPSKKTSDSARYQLPSGAVTVTLRGYTHHTFSASTMQVSIPAAGPDTLVVSCTIYVKGIAVPVTTTASLEKGAFPQKVLSHPTTFKSPQHLTAAVTAPGKGSKLDYTALGGVTVLGLAGTATSHT